MLALAACKSQKKRRPGDYDGSSDHCGADNGSQAEHATYFEMLQLAYNAWQPRMPISGMRPKDALTGMFSRYQATRMTSTMPIQFELLVRLMRPDLAAL